MHYLVDSDWAIDYVDSAPSAVQLLTPLIADGIAISIITYIEVYQGFLRKDPEILPQHEAALGRLVVLPLSVEIAQRCARVREDLRLRGRRTGSRALDLIIAATALEHDLTLVTRNVADYQDIPGLKLYR